jgi:CysZ protein
VKTGRDLVGQTGRLGLGVIDGAAQLFHGARWLMKRPKLLLLGALPAALVSAVMTVLVVVLLINIVDITQWATPFAENWGEQIRWIVRFIVGLAMLTGSVALLVALFAAITLAVGDPIYAKIWREVERDQFGHVPAEELRDPDSAHTRWGLMLRSLLGSITLFAVGLIPVIGGATAAVLNPVYSGWLLAGELTERACSARGMSDSRRRELLKLNRPATLGFGLAVHFSFVIPLGAIIFMPSAVVGASLYAHKLIAVDMHRAREQETSR